MADRQDQRDRRAEQLQALLTIITGDGFETFANYSGHIQGGVLWLARDLACEVHELCAGAREG